MPTVLPAQPVVGGARAHALEDAVCREHRRVAGAVVNLAAARRELRLLAHDIHVGDVGAHVGGRDVPASQALHEPSERAQQRLVLVRRGVADDDCLAAAVVQPAQCVLVGHGAREAKNILEGGLLRLIRVEAGATQCRPQGRGVDADDGAQACGLVVAEHHLLVAQRGEGRGGGGHPRG